MTEIRLTIWTRQAKYGGTVEIVDETREAEIIDAAKNLAVNKGLQRGDVTAVEARYPNGTLVRSRFDV